MTAAVEAFGRIDVLVNNTGINPAYGQMPTSTSTAAKVFEVNVLAALAWTRQARDAGLGARRGAVVNVASVAGLRPAPGHRRVRREQGGSGARHLTARGGARAVDPGERGGPVGGEDEVRDRALRGPGGELAAAYPLGRLGAPEDIAAAVAFLAGDDAAWITGQTLTIDGGSRLTGGGPPGARPHGRHGTTVTSRRGIHTMLGWRVTELGEPGDVMSLEDVPVPAPGPGQVLVDVWSAGLNVPDALLVRGRHPERPELPFTPGLELCGEVVGVGEGVERHHLGGRVMGVATLPHGTLAEYALAALDDVVPAPSRLDDASASVFHIAYQTGWFGLYRRAALRVGETLLVHAAAGGLGSAAVQLGRAAGARVIAVVGAPDEVAAARALGATTVVDRSGADVVVAVREATGGRGVDVVFDPEGGDVFGTSTELVGFEGRIVVVGPVGAEVARAATDHVLLQNVSVIGLHWGLYRRLRPDLVRRANDDLSGLVAAGALTPLLTERLAFEDAATGIDRIAAGATTGRVVVEVAA